VVANKSDVAAARSKFEYLSKALQDGRFVACVHAMHGMFITRFSVLIASLPHWYSCPASQVIMAQLTAMVSRFSYLNLQVAASPS
jgi:hypothetical protein